MNKYTELSDFEINKRIAEIDTKNKYVYFEKEQTIFMKFNNGQTQKFNPCNNPADAMPIIIENKIAAVPQLNGDLWVCSHYPFYVTTNNLYRAAMICLLLMKDAENEKV